jgi:hypothetical protein
MGRSDCGQVASFVSSGILQLFIAESSVSSSGFSFEFVDLIAEYCGISDPAHVRLLYSALSEPEMARVQAAFASQGFHVNITAQGKLRVHR